MLHLTAGERGNPRMDAAEYRRQRVREAQAAAKKLGAAECIVLDHPDGELHADQNTIYEMCDLVRRLKPDIVLTHWRGSFHRDHRAAYELTMEGGFLAALPDIKRALPAHLIRGLYYLEKLGGHGGLRALPLGGCHGRARHVDGRLPRASAPAR